MFRATWEIMTVRLIAACIVHHASLDARLEKGQACMADLLMLLLLLLLATDTDWDACAVPPCEPDVLNRQNLVPMTGALHAGPPHVEQCAPGHPAAAGGRDLQIDSECLVAHS